MGLRGCHFIVSCGTIVMLNTSFEAEFDLNTSFEAEFDGQFEVV